MTDNLSMFIPISKVDVAQRLVYGIATGETEDHSGEMCDYASTKPLYEKWSADFMKASNGKSFGNLRSMHGSTAAGKLTQIVFNDEEKQIEICAKVVDDAEWNKVQEGVYTGFSQGGVYRKRWKDEAGKQRYTAEPYEVSLVDMPCLPTATFSVIKADGAVEIRKFHTHREGNMPTNQEIAAEAEKLAKAAGSDKWGEFVDAARDALTKGAGTETGLAPAAELVLEKSVEADPAAAAEATGTEIDPGFEKGAKPTCPDIDTTADADHPPVEKTLTPRDTLYGEQVWKSIKDGSLHAKKADLIAYNEAYDARKAAEAAAAPGDALLAKLNAEVEKRAKPPEPVVEAKETLEKAAPADEYIPLNKVFEGAKGEVSLSEQIGMEKGLMTVSRLADLIDSLARFSDRVKREEASESDADSPLPDRMQSHVSDLCTTLNLMVAEETAELLANGEGESDPDCYFEYALKAPEGEFGVVRKFLPSKMVDSLIAKRALAAAEAERAAAEAAKAPKDTELSKALADDLRTERLKNEAMQKKLDDQAATLATILEKVTAIEETPLPLPIQGAGGSVSKGGAPSEEEMYRIAADNLVKNPTKAMLDAIKMAQTKPLDILEAGGVHR